MHSMISKPLFCITLLSTFAATLCLATPAVPPPPPAALAPLTPTAGQISQPSLPTNTNKAASRLEIDRLLRDARQQREQGNTVQAQTMMLEAAQKLRQSGYARDQVSIFREMTLDSDPGTVKAGSQAMADYYYRSYLDSIPRDAQWLLEALAWAHYSGDDALIKRFSARRPDKAHENIDERGKQRGEELRADDKIYLASEMIRLNQVDALKKQLQHWPYSIDRLHSLEGTSLLHRAAWYKKTGIARMLVEEYGANVNVVDLQSDTPLDYAEYQQADDLVSYFNSKGGRSSKKYPAKSATDTDVKNQPSLDQLQKQNPAALRLPQDKKTISKQPINKQQ